MKIHIVQKGDTLWKIAKKYGVNFEELKKMNTQLSNPDMIMPGMKIKVPASGGSIKKEAPIGGKPDAKINLGAKKEMPKAEQPFAKEKPITMPKAEAPKEKPVKEAPKKEMPKVTAPKVEIPKEVPKTAPKAEAPKEVPKKPYTPKMPKPIMPEIDINNYYMMNIQQPAPQQKQLPAKEVKPQQQKPLPAKEVKAKEKPTKPAETKPQQKPLPISESKPQLQLPPKPVNILPQVKPSLNQESPESPESESSFYTHQGGQYQPMFPYNPCYPQMPFPQVQGAMIPQMPHQMPQVQGAMMPQ
ncbi:SafA/ExsA family spore coat assembly protein, partial [Cytobacillus firmus]